MYENYCKARDALGLRDSDVSKATNINKSTFSDWKSGRSAPKNDKLSKIAEYLGVTVDYLITGESDNNGYYMNKESAEIAQNVFEDHNLRALFDAAKDAPPESIKQATAILKVLKGDVDD